MSEKRSAITADVIVVGAGNAALTAALAARETGADVVVLEAAPKDLRGGNSRFSGGIFRFAHGGMDHVRPLLTDRTRIVAITHMSNVLGTVVPVKEVVRIAHARGIPVLIDGTGHGEALRERLPDEG